jgi:hypothetical protein
MRVRLSPRWAGSGARHLSSNGHLERRELAMWRRIVLGPWRVAFGFWLLCSLPAAVALTFGRGPGQPVVRVLCAALIGALGAFVIVRRRIALRAVRRQAAVGVVALEAMLRQRTP